MANLLAAENWTCIDGCDELSNFEVSQIDGGDFVMSLLDNMQGDDDHHDDDRLTSVIKSLEAEIDRGQSCSTFDIVSELIVKNRNDNSFDDKQGGNYYSLQDFQSRDINGQDFAESNNLDFSWMETETEMEMEMNFWNIENNYGRDYPYTVPFEENDYHSFWQEQNV
ncbi:hypothetical protein HAX54_026591 [Datura stramonium]|uniref:Uncharacterized protein n=1 Tax=Datura stramonium TaxID=4076 RepID=A0ABS8V186_DATST|nr:hypothetical protein [Datura stramonium]